MSKNLLSKLLFLFFLFCPFILSQTGNVPVDPNVTIGKLKNGLTYYIHVNKKPEKRAELRLVVNAGSVLEDENQKGLAHFNEHMAFNGTTHFKHNDLEDYLESIGVRFGPDLNAYTSFDETVYMLQVPTDKPDLLAKGFLVLEDWAHGQLFDSVEVEKERGVITEEWRLGRGAQMRMLDKQFPILLNGSKYAERLPIGDVNIVQHCAHDVLKKFYQDWYRPDLMAVVAVGDFDKTEIESLIKKHFENIEMPKAPRPHEVFSMPPHEKTLYALASDKEATYTSIAVYNKRPHESVATLAEYKKEFTKELFENMMNVRLSELTQLADPPFIYGYVGSGQFARSCDINTIAAMVREGGVEHGLEAILREAERTRRFGFTATELERQKTELLRELEKQLAEKDKTESGQLINEYVQNYLSQSPIPGIENEYKLAQQFLPGITLEEVNKFAGELLNTANRVVMMNSPEKPEVKLPTEADLSLILQRVQNEELTAYVDKVRTQPLVSTLPKSGSVISAKPNAVLDYTEWKLSNGIRVLLKKTDFKNDEIIIKAFCPGGSSLMPDSDYISGVSATDILEQSGLGEFSSVELQKALSGKIVSVSPDISYFFEGFDGSCSPKDAETAFQLLYLYFTNPRFDSTAFQSFLSKTRPWLMNKQNNPLSVYNDTLTNTLNNYHFRFLPWTEKTLNDMSLAKASRIFKERFSDPAGFTFVFTGNIDTATFRPLVEQYLAGLSVKNSGETWRDMQVTNPTGVVEKIVKKGIEPKSTVTIIYTGDCTYSRHNKYLLGSLTGVMDIKLRESIREDKGGSYGVSVTHFYATNPKGRYHLIISFGCAPERVNELTQTAFQVIDSVKKFGPDSLTVQKIKEIQKRNREIGLKQNGFWSYNVSDYLMNEDDPSQLLEYPKWYESLSITDIKDAAIQYFNQNNYLKVVLLPETTKAP